MGKLLFHRIIFYCWLVESILSHTTTGVDFLTINNARIINENRVVFPAAVITQCLVRCQKQRTCIAASFGQGQCEIIDVFAGVTWTTEAAEWTILYDRGELPVFTFGRCRAIVSGSCFILETLGFNWYESYFYCRDKNGRLAESHNEQTNNVLAEMASGTYGIWMGAGDNLSEGQWQWHSSGEPLNFTNWGPEQPNGHSNSEDFLAIFDSGLWHDTRPDSARRVTVCEYII